MQLVRPLHETDGGSLPAANRGWPGGAKLGVVVLIHLDHVPALPGPDAGIPPSSVALRGPYPQIMDVHTTSQHEYGLRVGAFRILDLLDELRIPVSVAVDAHSARHRPRLMERIGESGAEFVAHGVDGISILHDGMDREEQRARLAESVGAVEEFCGVRPTGWSGLDYAQSTTALEDLAALGIRWTADWPNDEVPNVLATARGDVLNIPVSIHLDDVFSHLKRGIPIEKWADNIVSSARVLLAEDAPRNRTLVLGLHPWLIAQPFRFAHLREVLRTLRGLDGLWWARGADVAAHLDGERDER
ncbi:polysaccharide deacetylase family protein [Streptomyces sp. SHP 1-2]|uniref:polysaccharide deacetylase family protein n=1 Tax=Streptomyces sp. SHP 1-2 TaxID=2769489 RepID=UPI002238023F|nr:polysaccharide deacetylase family protein [Streptomyces sp. SHP 1-2]MCW5251447.1 polysaccharide deacetylase family protein [Streptomyces sp. SHP 1-2]